MAETYSVADRFVNKDPLVRELYDQLVSLLRAFGSVEEDIDSSQSQICAGRCRDA